MSGGVRDFSDDFMVEDAAAGRRRAPGGLPPGAPPPTTERESDPHRLAQRQKQVDLGKNTLGYQRYRAAVPRDKRNRKEHPITPDVHQVCSKRAFDGQVKKWRRMLHEWDLPEGGEQQGEPALLPVHTDRGPASNPAPPEAAADDYENISHADAAGGAAKNGGGLLRPVGNLPLKIPSAMRKRAYDETTAGSEAQQQPKEKGAAHSGQAAPGAKAARRSVDGAEASPGRSAAAAVAAAAKAKARAARTPAAAVQAKDPSWTDQRYTDPDLDYGEGSETEDEDGWQHVARPAAQLPGQYRSITNVNPLSWEDEIQI
ncbi:Oocyte-specific histone RNA stem-loop-binding 2 [Chlorella sorokiniana]|uniref:Oocyte-specific histone RNA stem-loop-binding 2 n=1 Tax=Chlorella sorokiniana TaxID=3076 RepID=A0A2P6TF30_CHLSO|nr:Oocyte-specific histone RNA stem-loop-binding 2 [Chlorella sorokiniana]|eukprot:PRW32578.1 Oocyte-specific histone RNA stem-loop-binding 2 [Chlorella sorokiniana]